MQVPEGYILISKVEYEQLRTDNEQLRKQVTLLMERIKELEGMLHKDSHNSHKPPSSDGLKKKVQNNREKSGRRAGGQTGHEGKTLEMVKNPDHIIEHKVSHCDHCGTDLSGIETKKMYRGQVHDLPPVKIEVTEHLSEVKQCPVCGKETAAHCEVPPTAQYGERIKSLAVYLNQYQMLPFERTRELMEDLFGGCPSAEVLQQSNQRCYDNIEHKVEDEIKESIVQSAVMHNDETGIRCEGKPQWIHVSSTQEQTYFAIDHKRGTGAMDRINILPRFTGKSIHDRWASYEKYEDAEHFYCNAHLLRDLASVKEENEKSWASEMKTILLEALALSEQEQTEQTQIASIEKRYDTLVTKAIEEEPLPQKPSHQRGKVAKSKSLKLLECFRDKKEKVLGFLHHPDVPFDNNLAERDLRMVKLKQKISGCFRTRKGAEVFCRIRSYISTLKKQEKNVWDALQISLSSFQFQPIEIRGG